MTALVVLYAIVAGSAASLAFLQLAAREEQEPGLIDGLGLMLASITVGVLWPLGLVLGGMALLGQRAGVLVWRSRYPEVLTDTERQTP